MIENIIIVAVLTAILSFALIYLYRAKKKGKKCIGCSACSNCSACAQKCNEKSEI